MTIMSPSRDKKKTNFKVPKPDSKKLTCLFCLSDTDNEDTLGTKLTRNGLTVHYFCLLFASGLGQRGKDESEGLQGFLAKDITREINRAKRLKCVFCGHHTATIGCVVPKCRKTFHFTCGLKHDVLNQYFGNFRSYCEEHRPIQSQSPGNRLTFHGNPDTSCCICLSNVDARPSITAIQAPCCKKAWFHKACIQQTATNAGLHFFKCPLCCNKEQFQDEMLTLGIYIPDQDASWEREPNAFQDLLHRHNRCDVGKCFSHKGRKYNKDGGKWEIVLCDFCGSSGTHLHCSGIKRQSDDWLCAECSSITGVLEEAKEKKKQKKKKSNPQTNVNSQQVRTTPGPDRPSLSTTGRPSLSATRTPAQKRSLTPSASSHSGSAHNSAKRMRREEVAATVVSPIIFADTRVPKPPKTPIVRTRHSWHPDDAPVSHYGKKKEEKKEDTDSPSTSRRLRRRPGDMKRATVTISPLPIGKLMCMKLLQDRRKTFEILSMSSPRKSQSAQPSSAPPRSSTVNRSLLSHYESTSQQVSRGSEAGPRLKAPAPPRPEAAAGPSARDLPDPKDSLDTPESCGISMKPKRLTLLPVASTSVESRFSVLTPLSPVPTMLSDSESNMSSDTCTSTLTEISCNTPSPFPKRKKQISPLSKQNQSPFSKLPPKKRYKFITEQMQSDDKDTKNPSYEGFLASIKNCFNNKPLPTSTVTSNAVNSQPDETCYPFRARSNSSASANATKQEDLCYPLRVRSTSRLSRSRSNTPVKKPQKPIETSLSSTGSDENDSSQMNSSSTTVNKSSTDASQLTKAKSLRTTSIKSYFSKSQINGFNGAVVPTSKSESQSDSSDQGSNATRNTRQVSKLSLSRSRSNTPQKLQLRSTTPMKTPKVSAFQNYQDFLASLEKKAKEGKSSKGEPTEMEKSCMSYDDFLSSLGVQELEKANATKQKRTSRPKQSKPEPRRKRGRPKRVVPRPEQTSKKKGTTPQNNSTSGDDVGYIDFTGEALYVADSDDTSEDYVSVSEYDSERTLSALESTAHESPYLDCDGDNCMSEEIINLFDNNNELEKNAEYSADSDDDEVIFCSVSNGHRTQIVSRMVK